MIRPIPSTGTEGVPSQTIVSMTDIMFKSSLDDVQPTRKIRTTRSKEKIESMMLATELLQGRKWIWAAAYMSTISIVISKRSPSRFTKIAGLLARRMDRKIIKTEKL